MSHIPHRKEKDCLNCGTIVQGHFCHNCGQENIVTHESFGHMVKHFVYDITHFDSKFFDSMRYLLFKPGFLPKAYIQGKRASYLNPIKKYVFTSAIFFLMFFSFFTSPISVELENVDKPLSTTERLFRSQKAEKELANNPHNAKLDTFLMLIKDTSKPITLGQLKNYWNENDFMMFEGRQYTSVKEYDSIQLATPLKDRDRWWVQLLQKKNLKIKEKYGQAPGKLKSVLFSAFFQKLPYMLFVSLPFFAGILKLLYYRRKRFYYADHGIFTIYHYVFSFFLLSVVFTLNKLADVSGWGFIDMFTAVAFLSGGVYLYLSMKYFYEQGYAKTLFKFVLLNALAAVGMIILFILFLMLSVFQI
ncbi:MAG: hypothetical protein RL115_1521 [Bacteroidota bacterium]